MLRQWSLVGGEAEVPAAASQAAVREAALVLRALPQLRCSLAWELTYVANALRAGLGATCHLRVNQRVAVSLSLSPISPNTAVTPYLLVGSDGKLADASNADVGEEVDALWTWSGALQRMLSASGAVTGALPAAAAGPANPRRPALDMRPIRPYHSLLLLAEPGDVLARLPADASPQLARLIAAASPLRSFNELQSETGVPSTQLLRLAAHLVHWGLAIVINTVTSHSVYAVAPAADLHAGHALARDFDRRFAAAGAGFTFAATLALFSAVVSPGAPAAAAAAAEAAAAAAGSAAGAPTPSSAGGAPVAAAAAATAIAAAALLSAAAFVPRGLRLIAAADAAGVSAGLAPHSGRGGGGGDSGRGTPLRELMAGMPRRRALLFLAATVFLLKHGFLRELHVHIYLAWPRPLRALAPGARAPGAEEDAAPLPLLPLHDYELALVRALCRGRPATHHFLRLLQYLRQHLAHFGPAISGGGGGGGGGGGATADAAADGDSCGGSGAGDYDDDDDDGDGEVDDGGAAAAALRPQRDTDAAAAGQGSVLRLGLRLEEVMWRLGLSRADIMALLAAYPDVFSACYHD